MSWNEGCKDVMSLSSFGCNLPSGRDINTAEEYPCLFVTTQWGRGRRTTLCYVVYRMLAAVGLITMVVVCIIDLYQRGDNIINWLTFLTNWSFIVLTSSTIYQCVLATYYFRLYEKCANSWANVFDGRLPSCLKFQWVIDNVALGTGCVACMVFWVALQTEYEQPEYYVSNFISHAANAIYLVLNLFITACPMKLYHVYQPVIFGFLYTFFSVTLQLGSNKTATYKTIDWTQPKTAIINGIMYPLLAIIIVWLVLYGLYRLRLLIHHCLQIKGALIHRKYTIEHVEQKKDDQCVPQIDVHSTLL